MMVKKMPHVIVYLCILLLLSACGSATQPRTLADIDTRDNRLPIQKKNTPESVAKSNRDIKKAYAEYLKHASKRDKFRTTAINRLAELEFELGDKLTQEKNSLASDNEDVIDAAYTDRLNTTVELITTSLAEYPEAKGNDVLLYNLANAYDQLGDVDKSVAALSTIVKRYPKSKYFLESQFRVAEDHFSHGDYVAAEDLYTKVIVTKKNDRFIEKALLKRGWARFKLEYYHEAVDDFLETVEYNNFDEFQALTATERDIFNEYFRAIGLSFSYMDDAIAIDRYFKNKPEFKHIFQVYNSTSEIYLRQNRYSDAANVLINFAKSQPDSHSVPESRLKIIDIWQRGGFSKKSYAAIEDFYLDYHVSHTYWDRKNSDLNIKKEIVHQLKKYTLLLAAHYHNTFQTTGNQQAFNTAEKWYLRYLKDYSQHSRKDNIHYLYAELLSEYNRHEKALYHYELSAYDGEIVLNKNAAYNTITLTSRLHLADQQRGNKGSKWLNKHIKYVALYSQLYPNEPHTPRAVTHAAELAFKSALYSSVIELATSVPDDSNSTDTRNTRILLGHAYLAVKQYQSAENVYRTILSGATSSYRVRHEIKDKLAFSIYQQAVESKNSDDIENAIDHFRRIAKAVPSSETAPLGMNEAINLSIDNEMWDIAINIIRGFQTRFPRHELNKDMSKKLSLAYLNAGQNIAAAQEYEKMSKSDNDTAVKIAALWKAAELYESNNKIQLAINAYSDFSSRYPEPYAQYMEAMHKVATLHDEIKNPDKAKRWRHDILAADKKAGSEEKSDRTKFIVSNAALTLAKDEYEIYKQLELTLPLKASLAKKKSSMQQTVKLFGQASVYGVAETTTTATYHIADIYQTFSQALLTSERPQDLNEEQLEQYEILLEDQAFPFEEKAIEFFEANVSHIKDDLYDQWISQSLSQLKRLFPARYQREAKADAAINLLH